MRRDKNHVVDFRQSHWLRGKILAKCCQDERRNGTFFRKWMCCGFVATVRDRKLFWSKFLVICVVQQIMRPGTVRQTHWLDPFNRDRRCDRWMRGGDMQKRWVIFSFYVQCKTRVTRYNKKLYSSGRKFLRFVLVYELACNGRVARKRQWCKTYRPFLCCKSTRLGSTACLPFGLPTL